MQLEKAKIIRPTQSPYNASIWPVKKPVGTWRMTVGYRELKKMTSPLHSAVPTVTDLMAYMSLLLVQYHYVVDLPNAFFSIDIALESQ